MITGIGGTGVITLGSLIGMAAHVEGLSATVLDYTGLAQKNGAVMSHIRIARSSDELHAVRIADGQSDALIACDMIVAVGPSALSRLSPSTRAVINDTIQPTSDFIRDGDIDFDNPAIRDILATLMGGNANFVNATELALASTGDSVATNAFMLGYAWQKGLIPLKQSSSRERSNSTPCRSTVISRPSGLGSWRRRADLSSAHRHSLRSWAALRGRRAWRQSWRSENPT